MLWLTRGRPQDRVICAHRCVSRRSPAVPQITLAGKCVKSCTGVFSVRVAPDAHHGKAIA